MSEAPDIEALARQLAVLEERMNTHQATYETALERLERRMAEFELRMAERETAAARRETVNTRWIVATITVGVIVIIAALGFLMRLPPPAG